MFLLKLENTLTGKCKHQLITALNEEHAKRFSDIGHIWKLISIRPF